MIDTESHAFTHHLGRVKDFFHFRRTHAIAGRFHHFITPTDKVKKPLRVHAYGVARKHSIFRQLETRRPARRVRCQQLVALGRLLSIVPVPHAHQRTAVHELSGFVGAAGRPVLAQHQNFRIWNGFAD